MKALFNARSEKRDKPPLEDSKQQDKEISLVLKSTENTGSRLIPKSSSVLNFLGDMMESKDLKEAKDSKESKDSRNKSKKEKFAMTAPPEMASNAYTISCIKQRLEALKLPVPPNYVILNIYKSPSGRSQVETTVRFMEAQYLAIEGIIKPFDSTVRLVGARNLGGVTCFIDSLLFAMFAKLDAFEYMIRKDGDDKEQQELIILLRTWVNMMRLGILVDHDMVGMLQNFLKRHAHLNPFEQQDCTELFGYLTDRLSLPLLQLQVDLYHWGKQESSDHQQIQERLVNVAVPDDGIKTVTLEDCLAAYFDSSIRVDRLPDREKDYSEVRDHIHPVSESSNPDISTPTPKTTGGGMLPLNPAVLRAQTDFPTMDNEENALKGPVLGIKRSQTMPVDKEFESNLCPTSVFQNGTVDKEGRWYPISIYQANPTQHVARAMSFPAHQVFRWIPWLTNNQSVPQNDTELMESFNQRPVLGISLKRWKYNKETMGLQKIETIVDIPDSMSLPYIIANDGGTGDDTLQAGYKLVLQAVVSHRGGSPSEGHYVSLVRISPKVLTENRRQEHGDDPPPDYEEPQWVKFDDLADPRVVVVSNLQEELQKESPYLLFYQIIPSMDSRTSTPEPPSYSSSHSESPVQHKQEFKARDDAKEVIGETSEVSTPNISVSINRVPTLPIDAMPNSPQSARNLSHLIPDVEVHLQVQPRYYLPQFYKLPEGVVSITVPSSPQHSEHASPRTSVDGQRVRASQDEVDPLDQLHDTTRPTTSDQAADSSHLERTVGGRTAFGRAVARFSRSASRHSRSSSHSAAPPEETSGRIAPETRKSISLSNITRGLTGKETRESTDVTMTTATTAPLVDSTHDPNTIRLSTDKSAANQLDGVPGGELTSVVITAVAPGSKEDTETDISKKRRKRGKKRAEMGSGSPDRQCAIM